MEIHLTKKFKREFRRLPTNIQIEAEKREHIFRHSPNDPRLKTHKLKGRLNDYWAFSVTYKHRIVFEFVRKDIVIFHSIGDHSVYY